MPPPAVATGLPPPPPITTTVGSSSNTTTTTNNSSSIVTAATAVVTAPVAVNSSSAIKDGQQTIPSTPSTPQLTPGNAGGGGGGGGARKKTSFQITSVKVHDGVQHADNNRPVIDEADNLVAENTTEHNGGHNGDVPPHEHNKGGPVKKHSITDPQAVAEQWSRRFKVVKIPFTEPFKRGRWTCQDFFDPPEPKQEDKPVQVNTSPGEGEVPPSEVTDGQAKDVTGSAMVPGSGVTPEEPSQSTSQASHGPGGGAGGTVLTPAPTQTPAPTPQGQEPPTSTNEGNYSACGAGGIDNKIEQAMDLVKSHLMFAVREEVDVLREKITELTEKNELLQQENSTLRSLLTPELAQRFAALQQQHKPTAPRPVQAPPNSLPAPSIPRTAPSLAAFGVPSRSSVSPVPGPGGTTMVSGSTMAQQSKPANAAVAAVSSPSSQQPTTSLPASLANVAPNTNTTTPANHSHQQTSTTAAAGALNPTKELSPPAKQ